MQIVLHVIRANQAENQQPRHLLHRLPIANFAQLSIFFFSRSELSQSARCVFILTSWSLDDIHFNGIIIAYFLFCSYHVIATKPKIPAPMCNWGYFQARMWSEDTD